MRDIKIDLVYLWVNNKDSNWQKKKEYYAKKSGISDSVQNNICRFSDNDELRYSLRSAQMYAPWINIIFIVTDEQVPKWLDISHPKINIVNHKDIMPKDCIPCFNSAAIEACIDNIEELSEYFLYANDDMFFSAPVTPEDFFDENSNPIISFKQRTKSSNLYIQRILYTQDLFNKTCKKNDNLDKVEPAHCIDAYRKSYIKDCKKLFAQEFDKLIHSKFRTEKTIQRIIYSLYDVEKHNCSFKLYPSVSNQFFSDKIDKLYFEINTKNSLENIVQEYRPKLLCINDTENANDEDRSKLKTSLANIFPQKQNWEKAETFTITPVFENNFRAIVFSFDDKYSKYFSAVLQSIIQNSQKDKNYDIIVLSSYIKDNNRRLLNEMLPENFSLRFFDISGYIVSNFPSAELKSVDYWSIEIYYRIFIPLIMPSYEKVMYLDTDMIINGSLEELFEMDFESKEIIAVKDVTAQLLHLDKYKERRKHFSNCLMIKNEKDYFNSGMLVFNIPSIDKSQYADSVRTAFQAERLLFPDQDILNMLFEGKSKLIPSRWNFCPGMFKWNKNIKECVDEDYAKDINQALQEPYIIHYTSPQKPWNSNLEFYYQLFWQYARQTPFYEDILFDMSKESAAKAIAEAAKFTKLYYQIQNEKKIVFWGASIFLEEFIKKYGVMNTNVIGIIDKDIHKKGQSIRQYRIYAPEDLKVLNPDEIIITIVNSAEERAQEVKDYLKKEQIKNITVKTI